MRTSLPIWMYTALASMTLIGLVLPPQTPVATPGNAAAAAAALPGGNPALTLPPPAIAFDAVTPIVVDRRDSSGNPVTTVMLKNDAPKAQTFELSVVLYDRDDKELTVVTDPLPTEIPAERPYLVSLTVKPKQTTTPADGWWREKLPVRGYAVLKTTGHSAPPVTRELRVTPAQPSSEADWVVLISLAAAVVAVVAGASLAGWKLLHPMGSPSWSDSWGSNATLGASLLTVFVGLVVFPEQTRFLPKTTYAVLSAVFPALVGLSPVIFGLVRTPAPASAAGSKVEYQGYVGAFCLAAVFTLWGALGQLATLVFAILELQVTPAFPTALWWLMLVIAGVLPVGVLVYGIVSVRQIIDAVTKPVPKPAPKPADYKITALEPPDDTTPRAALNWPLL